MMIFFSDLVNKRRLSKQLFIFLFSFLSHLYFSAITVEKNEYVGVRSNCVEKENSIESGSDANINSIHISGDAIVFDLDTVSKTDAEVKKETNDKLGKKSVPKQIKKADLVVAPKIVSNFQFNSGSESTFFNGGSGFWKVLFVTTSFQFKAFYSNSLQNIKSILLYFLALLICTIIIFYHTGSIRESYKTRPPPVRC